MIEMFRGKIFIKILFVQWKYPWVWDDILKMCLETKFKLINTTVDLVSVLEKHPDWISDCRTDLKAKTDRNRKMQHKVRSGSPLFPEGLPNPLPTTSSGTLKCTPCLFSAGQSRPTQTIKMEIGRRRCRLMQFCRNKGKETKALNIPVGVELWGQDAILWMWVCGGEWAVGGSGRVAVRAGQPQAPFVESVNEAQQND